MENKAQSNNENTVVNEHSEEVINRKNVMANEAKIINTNCPTVIIKTLYLLLKACNSSKAYDKLVNKSTESHTEIKLDDIKKEFDDFSLSKISNDTNISTDELFKTIKSLIDALVNNTSLGAINEIVILVSSTLLTLADRYKKLYKDEDKDKELTSKVKKEFNTFIDTYNKKERMDYSSFKERVNNSI